MTRITLVGINKLVYRNRPLIPGVPEEEGSFIHRIQLSINNKIKKGRKKHEKKTNFFKNNKLTPKSGPNM